jgi:SAM-dependent methyltransferase
VGPRSDAQAGVDLSPAFLAAARATYPAVGLAQSSGERLPFRDRAFESVISFEVIEHLQDDGGFLAELRRVTRPGGVVAISTPNRVFSSDGRARPINPFHVREYAADEFARLLRSAFNQVTLLGQHDSPTAEGGRGHLLDRVPMGWKYLVPTHVQGVLSVLVRRPLRIDDCRFSAQGMERAHSFLAICEL